MANQTKRLVSGPPDGSGAPGIAAQPAVRPGPNNGPPDTQTPAPAKSQYDGQTILDRYRLLQTVGQGGFGTVYLALDTWLQRRVAIKRIPLSAAETDMAAIKEARTEAMLKGPNIVLLWDFQLDGSDALLIMEHIDGPTLSDLLRESRELLDLNTIAAIAESVAAALQLAHQNQVLHLDIKPDNILIDHEGMVKVADFGLAQLSGISGFAKARGGTIGYMPPEQLQQQEIDCRSDLWAFATLLYQLLTGFNPFQADGIDESLQRILNDPLPLPSELRDDLDPAADSVIVQALMAAKELRPDSVSDFIGQLLPLLGKPKKGHRQLKLLVNNSDLDEIELSDDWHQEDGQDQEYLEDVRFEDEQPPDGPAAPPWQRMPRRLRGALGRLVAAAACGVFAFTGLSGFGLPQRFLPGTAADGQDMASVLSALAAGQLDIGLIVLAGVIALVAIGALIAPQLGSALAVMIMVAGLFAHGLVLFGIAAALLLVAWWLFFGRHGGPDATVVMLAPLLGALSLGFALPMLAGYYLPWRRALAAAGTQGLLLIILAASTGSATIANTGLILSPLDAASPTALTTGQSLAAAPTPTAMYASTSLASSVGSGIAGFVEMLLPGPTLSFLAAPLPWVSLLALMLAALVVSLPLSYALRRESQGQSKGSRGRTGQKQGRAAADDKDDLEIDEQPAGRSNLAMFFCLLLASLVLAASCIAVPELIAAGQGGSNTINLDIRQDNIIQQSVGLGLSFILLLILSLLGVPPSTGRIAVPTDETAG